MPYACQISEASCSYCATVFAVRVFDRFESALGGASARGILTFSPLTSSHREGCFCVRFVFSQGELMTEGGWAGVKVIPASEEA